MKKTRRSLSFSELSLSFRKKEEKTQSSDNEDNDNQSTDDSSLSKGKKSKRLSLKLLGGGSSKKDKEPHSSLPSIQYQQCHPPPQSLSDATNTIERTTSSPLPSPLNSSCLPESIESTMMTTATIEATMTTSSSSTITTTTTTTPIVNIEPLNFIITPEQQITESVVESTELSTSSITSYSSLSPKRKPSFLTDRVFYNNGNGRLETNIRNSHFKLSEEVKENGIDVFISSQDVSNVYIKYKDGVLNLRCDHIHGNEPIETSFCYVCDGERCNNVKLSISIEVTGSKPFFHNGNHITISIYREIVVGELCLSSINEYKEENPESICVQLQHKTNAFYKHQ